MAVTLLILNLFYLLSILISSGAQGVNIQAWDFTGHVEILIKCFNFLRDKLYCLQNCTLLKTGLVWESHSTAVCNNIPQNKKTNLNSIRTDTCYITYLNADCKSYLSQKYMPGDIVLSYGE